MVYKVPYKYIKDESYDPLYKTYDRHFVLAPRILPGALIFIGLGLFVWQVVLPFMLIKGDRVNTKTVKGSVLGATTGFGDFSFDELQTFGPAKDAVTPKLARETEEVSVARQNIPKYFYLTIEKLGIKRALVETNPSDLDPDDALGHYPGSALPGEVGNVFIYGHSVLPVFYSPKNYKAIFSKIDSLKTGDKIILDYNNIKYTYLVEDHVLAKPSDVNPLAEFKPRYLNESTVTLMTCYPAGSKAMRYMVRATLSE